MGMDALKGSARSAWVNFVPSAAKTRAVVVEALGVDSVSKDT